MDKEIKKKQAKNKYKTKQKDLRKALYFLILKTHKKAKKTTR